MEETERKMKPKDPKEEVEKAEKGTGIKTMIQPKMPYLDESESEYRASQDLKKRRRESERMDRR